MDSQDLYSRLSFKYFSEFSRKYLLATFKDLQKDIERANISMTLLEYLSITVSTSVIVFFFMSLLSPVIIYVLMLISTELGSTAIFMISLFMGFLAGLLASSGIFMMFYTYPSIVVGSRRKRIDDTLPFATLYLATIAGSGTPTIAMFRALAKFKEYGEISKEAQGIIEETDVLGENLAAAIENAANRTPSDRLRDILWGIKSIILVGGNLRDYLHGKAENTMQDYKRRLAQFTQGLSMLIEMYITVVIVGSVFFMVLTTIMGTMNANNLQTSTMIVMLQFIITFVFLPGASFGFMVLIKGMAPSTKA